MIEDVLPSNVPAWLQKDLLSTVHEVPVANDRSHTTRQNYYTPRLVRWALDQWFASLPRAADPTALQRALQTVCADPRAFHAYLQVPEAFAELYDEEIGRQLEHRSELDSVKRVLDADANRNGSDGIFRIGCAMFSAIAFCIAALAR